VTGSLHAVFLSSAGSGRIPAGEAVVTTGDDGVRGLGPPKAMMLREVYT
jgi:hypothetical protein